MGGRGATSGRKSGRGGSASLASNATPQDRMIARIEKRATEDYNLGANRSDLNLAGSDNTLLRQVKSARISSITPTSFRFRGSNHDWHIEGPESVSASTATTKYTISKPSKWSSEYVLSQRRGINNEVAVASSKNVDTLIKRVQRKLK